jgi:hypothetical protein
VSHGTAMQLALGTAATNATTRFTFAKSVPNCGVADVACDEHGLRLLTFMGEDLGAADEQSSDGSTANR